MKTLPVGHSLKGVTGGRVCQGERGKWVDGDTEVTRLTRLTGVTGVKLVEISKNQMVPD